MRISEIFYSIQGEGSLAGVPSVFVRTGFCNLRCVWCDTPYASWRPEGTDLSVDQIIEAVKIHRARHSVITGGEPMIETAMVELTAELKNIGQHITIETAGTVFKAVVCDLMSISPKLANSTPHKVEGGRWAAQHERLRYQPDVLRQLAERYPCQLKFVVTSPGDLAEVRSIVSDIGADPQQVMLMPEGTAPGVLTERSEWLVEVCKAEGFRFSPRLHVMIWGDKRGV